MKKNFPLAPVLLALAAAFFAGPLAAQQLEPQGLKSEFLFELVLETAPQQQLGSRSITPIQGGSFAGPNLKGKVLDLGADWLHRQPDGNIQLDVRITLQTDDDALIYMTYKGIISRADSGLYWRMTPRFETASEKYAWLNGVVAVGVGMRIDGKTGYHVYRIL